MNQIPKPEDSVLIETGFLGQAFKKSHMSDTDLEFRQSRCQHGLRRHGYDFGVRVRAGSADQFGAHLRIFLQSALQAGVIYKAPAKVAQTDRMIHILEITARSPRDRRREIRPENQRISLSVEEFEKIA